MSIKKDNLGDRMKGYENIPKNFLTRRVPVIIRLDGKAFHTFTKGFEKPFDDVLIKVMQRTMKYLCENIQGCVFGYTQSDEITLVLTDYAIITTDAWFGYNVEKMTSISASMATLAFNKFWDEEVHSYVENKTRKLFMVHIDEEDHLENKEEQDHFITMMSVYKSRFMKAMFDSRVFSVPKDEVCNCLIWRQQDATRNSIQSVGQANFSPKQLNGKTCNMIQDMLMTEKGINWNDYSTYKKRGTACYKVEEKTGESGEIVRHKWYIDEDMPILTQDRNYVEKWI